MRARKLEQATALRGLATLLFALAIAAGCVRTPPEQALRNAFDGLHRAVEGRDAGDVAAFLADDFIGPGGLDRDGAPDRDRMAAERRRLADDQRRLDCALSTRRARWLPPRSGQAAGRWPASCRST